MDFIGGMIIGGVIAFFAMVIFGTGKDDRSINRFCAGR